MPDTTVVPQDTENSEAPGRFPRLYGPVVFRVICALVAVAIWRDADCAWPPILVLPREYAVYIGAFSLLVAAGLAARLRWAAWAAVAFDVVVYPLLLGMRLLPMIGYGDSGYVVINVLAFLTEAALLLRALQPRRAAVAACALLACVLVGVGVGIEMVPRYRALARVAPAIRWIDKHWIGMPSSFVYWDIDVRKSPYPQDRWFDLHASRFGHVRHQPDSICVLCRMNKDGNPLVPNGDKWPELQVRVSYLEHHELTLSALDRPILKPSQILRMLRRYGAPGDLRFVGVCDGQEPRDTYRFYSARADAYYRTRKWLDLDLDVDMRHAE